MSSNNKTIIRMAIKNKKEFRRFRIKKRIRKIVFRDS